MFYIERLAEGWKTFQNYMSAHFPAYPGMTFEQFIEQGFVAKDEEVVGHYDNWNVTIYPDSVDLWDEKRGMMYRMSSMRLLD